MPKVRRRKNNKFKGTNYWDVVRRGSTTPSTPVSEAAEAQSKPTSRSKKKLQGNVPSTPSVEPDCHDSKTVVPSGYRLIDLQVFGEGICSLHCPNMSCPSSTLKLLERPNGQMGFASDLVILCSVCSFEVPVKTSAKPIQDENRGRSHDINRRMTYVASQMGFGQSGLDELATYLGMPGGLSMPSFQLHLEHIETSLYANIQCHFDKAAEHLKKMIEDEDESSADISSKYFDIAVSFDGSWQKRGHTSIYGVVTVISPLSGEVLDAAVLCKKCVTCERMLSILSEAQFVEWFKGHENRCEKNFEGSSPAMEAEGACILWKRSKSRGFRYTHMISDGDAKSYSAVVELDPYREDGIKVEKIDCMGHVQKRMGTNLFNLKKSYRGRTLLDGKTMGGRGRLTDDRIKRFQQYYGKAIRSNLGNVANMRNAVWAILYHSTKMEDRSKQHQFCSDTWCKWKQDQASGESTYSDKQCLPNVFFEVLKPLFTRLSDERLLQRVMHGYTQNPNESLHSIIWKKAPKHLYHSLPAIQVAVYSAIMQYNKGFIMHASMMEAAGLRSYKFTTINAQRCLETCITS